MKFNLGNLEVVRTYKDDGDMDQLRVRINAANKPDSIEFYDYIHLRTGNKKISCQLRGDNISNAKERYLNEKQIRINEHLRLILKVEIGEQREFYMVKAQNWLRPYYYMRYHPNDVLRTSIWLAFIAIVLGVSSVIIAILN